MSAETTVSTAVTVPPAVHVQMTGTGQFAHAGAGSIAFDGSLGAPLRQVFRGFPAGTIGLAPGSVAEAYPQWWGAKGQGKSDDTRAVQAAIDACNSVAVPPGDYLITSTILVNNRMGFTLTGAGIQTTTLAAGTAGMVLFRLRNTMYSSFNNLKLDGRSIANRTLVIDQVRRGAQYVTDQDFFTQVWFGYATDIAVVVGDDNNGQTDRLRFDDCIFSNSP